MPRLLRVSKAKELIYTGRMIGVDEALQMGLVNKVVKNIEVASEHGIESQDSINNGNKKSSTAEYWAGLPRHCLKKN